MANPLGDLELTDAQAMRALAHPVRLAILDRLQRHGPATATQLSPEVGATPSVTSWHLRHLAGFGLVRDSEPGPDRRARRWEAVARGFRFSVPVDGADPDAVAAARLLSRQLFARTAAMPLDWAEQVEPELDETWRAAAGVQNTRVVISAAEAAALTEAIEELLAPLVARDPSRRPAGARTVRLLRYVLPEAAPDAVTDR